MQGTMGMRITSTLAGLHPLLRVERNCLATAAGQGRRAASVKGDTPVMLSPHPVRWLPRFVKIHDWQDLEERRAPPV